MIRSTHSPRSVSFTEKSPVHTQWRFQSYWQRVRLHPLALGDRVDVPSSLKDSLNGWQSGLLRYLGEIHCTSGYWAGVELDKLCGKNDGTIAGRRYFVCDPYRGLFVRVGRCRKHHVRTSTSNINGRIPLIQGRDKGNRIRLRLASHSIPFDEVKSQEVDLKNSTNATSQTSAVNWRGRSSMASVTRTLSTHNFPAVKTGKTTTINMNTEDKKDACQGSSFYPRDRHSPKSIILPFGPTADVTRASRGTRKGPAVLLGAEESMECHQSSVAGGMDDVGFAEEKTSFSRPTPLADKAIITAEPTPEEAKIGCLSSIFSLGLERCPLEEGTAESRYRLWSSPLDGEIIDNLVAGNLRPERDITALFNRHQVRYRGVRTSTALSCVTPDETTEIFRIVSNRNRLRPGSLVLRTPAREVVEDRERGIMVPSIDLLEGSNNTCGIDLDVPLGVTASLGKPYDITKLLETFSVFQRSQPNLPWLDLLPSSHGYVAGAASWNTTALWGCGGRVSNNSTRVLIVQSEKLHTSTDDTALPMLCLLPVQDLSVRATIERLYGNTKEASIASVTGRSNSEEETRVGVVTLQGYTEAAAGSTIGDRIIFLTQHRQPTASPRNVECSNLASSHNFVLSSGREARKRTRSLDQICKVGKRKGDIFHCVLQESDQEKRRYLRHQDIQNCVKSQKVENAFHETNMPVVRGNVAHEEPHGVIVPPDDAGLMHTFQAMSTVEVSDAELLDTEGGRARHASPKTVALTTSIFTMMKTSVSEAEVGCSAALGPSHLPTYVRGDAVAGTLASPNVTVGDTLECKDWIPAHNQYARMFDHNAKSKGSQVFTPERLKRYHFAGKTSAKNSVCEESDVFDSCARTHPRTAHANSPQVVPPNSTATVRSRDTIDEERCTLDKQICKGQLLTSLRSPSSAKGSVAMVRAVLRFPPEEPPQPQPTNMGATSEEVGKSLLYIVIPEPTTRDGSCVLRYGTDCDVEGAKTSPVTVVGNIFESTASMNSRLPLSLPLSQLPSSADPHALSLLGSLLEEKIWRDSDSSDSMHNPTKDALLSPPRLPAYHQLERRLRRQPELGQEAEVAQKFQITHENASVASSISSRPRRNTAPFLAGNSAKLGGKQLPADAPRLPKFPCIDIGRHISPTDANQRQPTTSLVNPIFGDWTKGQQCEQLDHGPGEADDGHVSPAPRRRHRRRRCLPPPAPPPSLSPTRRKSELKQRNFSLRRSRCYVQYPSQEAMSGSRQQISTTTTDNTSNSILSLAFLKQSPILSKTKKKEQWVDLGKVPSEIVWRASIPPSIEAPSQEDRQVRLKTPRTSIDTNTVRLCPFSPASPYDGGFVLVGSNGEISTIASTLRGPRPVDWDRDSEYAGTQRTMSDEESEINFNTSVVPISANEPRAPVSRLPLPANSFAIPPGGPKDEGRGGDGNVDMHEGSSATQNTKIVLDRMSASYLSTSRVEQQALGRARRDDLISHGHGDHDDCGPGAHGYGKGNNSKRASKLDAVGTMSDSRLEMRVRGRGEYGQVDSAAIFHSNGNPDAPNETACVANSADIPSSGEFPPPTLFDSGRARPKTERASATSGTSSLAPFQDPSGSTGSLVMDCFEMNMRVPPAGQDSSEFFFELGRSIVREAFASVTH